MVECREGVLINTFFRWRPLALSVPAIVYEEHIGPHLTQCISIIDSVIGIPRIAMEIKDYLLGIFVLEIEAMDFYSIH